MAIDPTEKADSQICRQCSGLCCQGHPGLWVDPERFLQVFDLPRPATPETLRRCLPKEIVLRSIDGIAIAAPVQLEAGCIFWDTNGCQLPETSRPGQCLALMPVFETLVDGEIHCELHPEGSTLSALRKWRDFWKKAEQNQVVS